MHLYVQHPIFYGFINRKKQKQKNIQSTCDTLFKHLQKQIKNRSYKKIKLHFPFENLGNPTRKETRHK